MIINRVFGFLQKYLLQKTFKRCQLSGCLTLCLYVYVICLYARGGRCAKTKQSLYWLIITTSNIIFYIKYYLSNWLLGRDHGLPSYLEWRQWCGLDERKIESWNELANVIKDDQIRFWFTEFSIYSSSIFVRIIPTVSLLF